MDKKNNGITLIALVITIIVLLILAGVSIATLTGENGIITQATVASEKTNLEQLKEELEQSKSSINIDNILNGTKSVINAEGYEELKNYIPSITENYANNLKIEDNELVFKISATDAEKDVFIENNIPPETVEAPAEWFAYEGGKLLGFSDEIKLQYDIDSQIKNLHPEWYDEDGNLKDDDIIYEQYWSLGDELDNERRINCIKLGFTRMKLPSISTEGVAVTQIGSSAFNGYHEISQMIEKLILPETVEMIDANAFIYQSINIIRIPSSVKEICVGAFSGNPLKQIIFEGDTPTLNFDVSVGAFGGYQLDKIKVPKEYIEKYKKLNCWIFEFSSNSQLLEVLESY